MLTVPTPAPSTGGGVIGPLLRDPGGVLSRLAHHVGTLAAGQAPPVLAALVAVTLLAVAAHRLLHRHRHRRALVDARVVEILTPPEVDPDGAQRLWGNLVGLLRPAWRRLADGQPHLVWQYAFTPTGATLSLWVPGVIPPGLVERAIEAAWPAARTRTVRPAPDPLPAAATATAGRLLLHRAEVLPLRIEAADDAVAALLGAATGLAATESAVVQVLARPVTGRRTRAGHRAARQLRAGQPLRSRTAGLLAAIVEFVVDVALLRPTRPSIGPVDPAAVDTARAVLGKAASPQYEVAVRYAAADTTPTGRHAQTPRAQARGARDRVRGRAHAVASAFALYTGHNGFTRRRLRHPAHALTDRRLDRGQLMSVPELAALARLPADPTAPGIRRAGARSVPPPPGIPTDTGSDVQVLGDADNGPRRPVAVDVPALRHHTHLIGATGSGKTTLIVHLAAADARHHRGLMVLDSRDTVPELADHLDSADRRRAILIDPDQPGPVPVLNPLDVPATDAERAVDNICAILHRIYAASWGPRTDDILACCCHTLLTDRQATGRIPSLADVPRLLTDTAFRHRATAHLSDRDLAIFWRWYTDLTDVGRAQAIGPVLNKLRAFLRHRFARRLLTGASTLTLTDILDGGILLARLPKGLLGDDGARLLGSFLMGAAWHAATGRAHHPEHTRRDAAIYLDEAHNWLNLPYPIEDMLAEARGYRVAFVIAHQNLAQLPADLREGISTNARNKIFFSLSPEDARDLAHHTLPALTAHDLSHLGEYAAAARLVVGHGETAAFTLRTRPLPPARRFPALSLAAAIHDDQTDRRARRATSRGGTTRSGTPPGSPRRPAANAVQRIPGDPRTAATPTRGSTQPDADRDQPDPYFD